MKAKEMFEALGYEYYEGEYSIRYIANCDIDDDHISICFGLLSHTFYAQHNCNTNDITIDEFQAIQQQMKELGWLDEEETCTNESEYNLVDGFECSNCGIIIENYNEIEIDEDYPEDRCMKEYAPRYCPNCGRKIVEENKND